MRIEYSIHAKKRMIERGVKEEAIREALDLPEYTIKRGEEIEVYKKINNKMLKVVYVNYPKFIKVITLYWL